MNFADGKGLNKGMASIFPRKEGVRLEKSQTIKNEFILTFSDDHRIFTWCEQILLYPM